MSETLELFSQDHAHALEMVAGLQKDLDRLTNDEDLPLVRQGLEKFVAFLDHALNVHFRQEEQALFPLMVEADANATQPVEAMLAEHRIIETAHRNLKEELAGEKPSPQIITGNGEKIIEVLRGHINREDQALFPFALRILGKGMLDEVDRRRKNNA